MTVNITLDTPFQIGNTLHSVPLRDMLTLGNGTQTQVFQGVSAGAMGVTVRAAPLWITAGLGYVVLKPYTVECMVRKVTGINGNDLTWETALDYDVDTGDPVMWISSPRLAVSWFGAKADARKLTGLSINSGTNVLNGSGFSQADVGKDIIVYQAGASEETLDTTIAAFVSSSQVTLAANAGTTAAAVGGVVGSDAKPGIQAGVDQLEALGGGSLLFDDGYYFMQSYAQISAPNIHLDGHGCTIYKDTQAPGSGGTDLNETYSVFYVKGSGVGADPMTMDVYNVVIENFVAENIGQTYGPATDDHYWTTLNNTTTGYNRNYNKHINYGALVCHYQAHNTIVRNCKTTLLGSLVIANSYTGACHVEKCTAYGWGSVCVYPTPGSVIDGNWLEQTAPTLDQTDSNNDRGTSHCIYVTSAYDNVKIINNKIINARLVGIKFNTATGNPFLGNIVAHNYIERAFSSFQFNGTLSGSLRHQFDVFDNDIINCGPIYTDSGWLNLNLHNNRFRGYQDQVNAYHVHVIRIGSYGNCNWVIENNDFYDCTGTGTHEAIALYIVDGTNFVSIKQNRFHSSCKYGILVTASSPTGADEIMIADNDFYCQLYIQAACANYLGNTKVVGNRFHSVGQSVTYLLRCEANGLKLIQNVFFVGTDEYAFAVTGSTGSDYTWLIGNVFIGNGVGANIAHRWNLCASNSVYLIGNRYENGAYLSFSTIVATPFRKVHDELENSFPVAVAPTTPTNGDMIYGQSDWASGEGIYARVAGAWVKL